MAADRSGTPDRDTMDEVPPPSRTRQRNTDQEESPSEQPGMKDYNSLLEKITEEPHVVYAVTADEDVVGEPTETNDVGTGTIPLDESQQLSAQRANQFVGIHTAFNHVLQSYLNSELYKEPRKVGGEKTYQFTANFSLPRVEIDQISSAVRTIFDEDFGDLTEELKQTRGGLEHLQKISQLRLQILEDARGNVKQANEYDPDHQLQISQPSGETEYEQSPFNDAVETMEDNLILYAIGDIEEHNSAVNESFEGSDEVLDKATLQREGAVVYDMNTFRNEIDRLLRTIGRINIPTPAQVGEQTERLTEKLGESREVIDTTMEDKGETVWLRDDSSLYESEQVNPLGQVATEAMLRRRADYIREQEYNV